jgi:hypothetical protein
MITPPKDLFSNNKLHPGHDVSILEYYKNHFDSVYISFSPFFQIKEGGTMQESYQKARPISFEEAQAANDLFQHMPDPAGQIYIYDNENYPGDKQINVSAVPVTWKYVIEGAGFENKEELHKALKTSIGAYKKIFERQDLAKRLWEFTNTHQIYIPTEGHFEILTKKEIYKAFQLLQKDKLTIEEEFRLNRRELDLTGLTEKEFVEAINFKDYFIYDTDKSLLFAIDWDDFFFLVCSNKQNLQKIVSTLNFEGFYCSETTEAAWEMTKEEIQAGLEKERQESNREPASEPVIKKPWWKWLGS